MSAEGTIFAVAIVPDPWPPPSPVRLLSQDQAGSSVALRADANGQIVVSVDQASQSRTRAFGPLQLPGAARVVFAIRWSHAGIDLFANGVRLEERVMSAAECSIASSPAGERSREHLFPGLRPRSGMTEAEHLLVSTVIDLDQKVFAGDRYGMIRASGLLRQLFLDETPLVHTVNREHRVALAFRTMEFSQAPPVEPEAHWRLLDPEPFPRAKTQTCSLKEFLAAPCLTWRGSRASVTDLIRACANVKGGVHLGRTKIANEQLLLDWDEVFSILGEQPSLRAIAAVCRVALRGLTGLVRAIESRSTPTRGSS